uniref:Uncharacterized protein n=1 Tax=Clytia hemisphaerica TaxID=252671 RepID=A0A7M6DRA2_9CNID
MLFNYNISNDQPSVDLLKLCGSYARQIRRVENHCIPQQIAKFPEHSESVGYDVCQKKLSIHEFKVVKEPVSLSIKIIDCAKKYGFLYAEQFKKYTFVRAKESLNAPVIDQTIYVFKDLLTDDYRWQIIVFDRFLSPDKIPALQNLERILRKQNFENFFQYCKDLSLFTGNDDLENLIASRKEGKSSHGSTVLENVQLEAFSKIEATIRYTNCDILLSTEAGRCDNCQVNRKSLQTMERRKSLEDDRPKAKKPHSSMTKEQLKSRLKTVAKENKELKRKQKRLEKKIEKLVRAKGVKIKDKGTQQVVDDVLKGECPFDEKSPMFLLWEQQKKAAKLKKLTSMRWHPVIIRWCLSINLRSPGK